MPRAKKSETKAKDVKPAVVTGAEPGSEDKDVTKASATRPAVTVVKTTESAAKPVSSVNAEGTNAGVKSNGKVDSDLEAAIRARAYEIWERRGRPQGAGHDDWLEAEREILAEYSKRTA